MTSSEDEELVCRSGAGLGSELCFYIWVRRSYRKGIPDFRPRPFQNKHLNAALVMEGRSSTSHLRTEPGHLVDLERDTDRTSPEPVQDQSTSPQPVQNPQVWWENPEKTTGNRCQQWGLSASSHSHRASLAFGPPGASWQPGWWRRVTQRRRRTCLPTSSER